ASITGGYSRIHHYQALGRIRAVTARYGESIHQTDAHVPKNIHDTVSVFIVSVYGVILVIPEKITAQYCALSKAIIWFYARIVQFGNVICGIEPTVEL